VVPCQHLLGGPEESVTEAGVSNQNRIMYVCMFQHNFGTPGSISTKLGTHMTICIYKNYIYIISMYIKNKNGCMCVCMFQHNSETPGAISTKLGTNMTI
jgi:hypothetical protein